MWKRCTELGARSARKRFQVLLKVKVFSTQTNEWKVCPLNHTANFYIRGSPPAWISGTQSVTVTGSIKAAFGQKCREVCSISCISQCQSRSPKLSWVVQNAWTWSWFKGAEKDAKDGGFMITMLLRAVDLPSAACLVQLGFSASFPEHWTQTVTKYAVH